MKDDGQYRQSARCLLAGMMMIALGEALRFRGMPDDAITRRVASIWREIGFPFGALMVFFAISPI